MSIRVPFGMSTITIGATPLELGHQADKAIFTASPKFIDIDLYDAPHYDKFLEGWDVQLVVTLDDENLDSIMQSLTAAKKIQSEATFLDVGVQDGALHQRMRDKAQQIVIHPNDLDAEDNSFDVTIFKAIAISPYERIYGKEQSKWQVTFQGLHRTGSPQDAGSYFRIGKPAS